MFGYIYKTTNNINGKFYIGKRQKSNFDKYYYGSGKYLSHALLKYGKENFSREILEWCDSLETLNAQEKYWIQKLDSRNPEIGYNIAEGGDGGGLLGKTNGLFCYVHKDYEIIRVLKAECEIYLDNGYVRGKGPGSNGLIGTKKTDRTKQKMSQSGKGKHNHNGEKNPCYGCTFFWINDGFKNKRLSLDTPIPEGWVRGKIQKKPEMTEKFINAIDKRKHDGHWSGNNNPSKNTIGMHWYTNGIINVKAFSCPEGFHKGKITGSWYNNGKEEIQIIDESNIPEGYIKGRMKYERETNKQ